MRQGQALQIQALFQMQFAAIAAKDVLSLCTTATVAEIIISRHCCRYSAVSIAYPYVLIEVTIRTVQKHCPSTRMIQQLLDTFGVWHCMCIYGDNLIM